MTERAPVGPWQALREGNRLNRVGGARELVANAAPLPSRTSAVAEALSSLASAGDRTSQIDTFTLAADGAQDVTLSFLPVEESWNVTLNGITALFGTDYTVSGPTVSLLTPLGALTGDKVQVQYDYYTGIPTEASNEADLNVPFQASGWKWHEMSSSSLLTNYVDPGYDDSSWSTGTCPFGWGTYTDVDGHAKNTTVAHINTGQLGHEVDFVVRRIIGPGTAITVTTDEKNYCVVYANGVQYGSASTGGPLKFATSIPDQPFEWLLAVYITVANGATNGGVDIKVEGTPL